MANNNLMWGFLLHLGFNMWSDANPPTQVGDMAKAADYLRCDKKVWDETVDSLKANGCNTLVIDLGEGIQYESHPEISAKGAWTKNELCDELSKLRSMGFEVIPKLNFSAAHDEWLGIYSKMLSTPAYYKVRDDLIDEVCELFDRPRLFHLGMDEEVYSTQTNNSYCVIREGDLYWHDLEKLFKRCEKNGARPWIWADYVWHRPDREKLFLERMSKEVLLSNWYYRCFEVLNDWHDDCAAAFKLLDEHGFEQVPTGSNFVTDESFGCLVNHAKENLSPDKLCGFLMTTWKATVEERKDSLMNASKVLGDTIKSF